MCVNQMILSLDLWKLVSIETPRKKGTSYNKMEGTFRPSSLFISRQEIWMHPYGDRNNIII